MVVYDVVRPEVPMYMYCIACMWLVSRVAQGPREAVALHSTP